MYLKETVPSYLDGHVLSSLFEKGHSMCKFLNSWEQLCSKNDVITMLEEYN